MSSSKPGLKQAFTSLGLAAALSLGTTATGHAQEQWPTRPVTIIVPGAAGGSIDSPIRLLAQKLEAAIGQPIVVVNRPGSGGIIGTQAMLRAPADGYTLLAGNVGPQAINYSAYSNLQYSPGDFKALTDVISFPNILVVNEKSKILSVKDLVEEIKANPKTMSYGSAGIGQTSHLLGELFTLRTNTSAVHVPYKGSAPATIALLADETSFQFDNLTLALPHIQAGKLRPLAVTTTERLKSLPNVPTMDEAGFNNLLSSAWVGIFASAKTDPQVAAQIEGAFRTAMNDAPLREQLIKMGGIPGGMSAAEFEAFVESEQAKWKEAIDSAGLKLD